MHLLARFFPRWSQRLIPPIKAIDLERLPDFSLFFLFKNLDYFRFSFIILSLISCLTYVVRFIKIWLLSYLISNLAKMELDQIYYNFLPAYTGAIIIQLCLEYIIRRQGEAIGPVYGSQLLLRFLSTFFRLSSPALYNYSKSQLLSLIQRYVGDIKTALDSWCWHYVPCITNLVICFIVLGSESLWLALFSFAYLVIYLIVAFGISSKFRNYLKDFAEKDLAYTSLFTNFAHSLSTIRSLAIADFASQKLTQTCNTSSESYQDLKQFHAWRWFLQNGLFLIFFTATVLYCAIQIKHGEIEIGYLVLIKFAFDELWLISAFMIEGYAVWLGQRENARLMRAELAPILAASKKSDQLERVRSWSKIELKDVTLVLGERDKETKISFPHFIISCGEKVGVIGPSGSGKSTLLSLLMLQNNFSGSYLIDGQSVINQSAINRSWDNRNLVIISNNDPLFALSLKDNILLGRDLPQTVIEDYLRLLNASELISRLEQRVGSADFALSAGQEQRIRLIRGLLALDLADKSPEQVRPLILLDEPLNNLDKVTKETALKFLKQKLVDETVILVTHNREELSLVERSYNFTGHQLSGSAELELGALG